MLDGFMEPLGFVSFPCCFFVGNENETGSLGEAGPIIVVLGSDVHKDKKSPSAGNRIERCSGCSPVYLTPAKNHFPAPFPPPSLIYHYYSIIYVHL